MTMEKELVQQAHKDINLLKEQIGQAIIGQEHVIDQTIICLIAAGHALVEGVPGLGKTLLVKAIAQSIEGQFSRVQFTPDLMPTDVTGHTMYDIQSQKWHVRRGPVFCNFLLADEINRAPAKTQSALLEVMQEQQVTIEGKSFVLEQPFLVLATQNPIEQEGTYPLPEAQLDRFLLNIKIDYPDEQEEQQMVKRVTSGKIGDKLDISQVQKILSPERILELQQIAATLEMDEQIIDYAVRIVRATRDWNGISIGAGPRGSIALLRAARSQALLSGNHFVTPDDIKTVAPAVLRHRLVLTADYEIEGYTTDRVLSDILQNCEAPRV
ncbi:MAG: AAA domain-containing protein [Gammaproteobacteria bacterium]|nr:AAA domain-containing protein [Gammaproteobacteria bacterium]